MMARGASEMVSSRSGVCRLWTAICAMLALAAGGCAESELETSYGRQQQPFSTASVNGTDVLAGMFSQAGHSVAKRRIIVTSDMESVDTIVWFPDDFSAPSDEICQWFDRWLCARGGRTLVYVGRGYDAAPAYWRKMAPLVSPEQQVEYRNREREASLLALPRPEASPGELTCDWFDLHQEAAVVARELAGPWSRDVDSLAAEIELDWRLTPHDASALLTTGGEPLVSRLQRPPWGTNQLVLIANGSFLLNLPLVNHEHRKLAGKLIEAAGPPGSVVFLESGHGGPPLDPPAADHSLWRALGAWPLNAILLHFAVLGVIFSFARWPIFGRPKTPPAEVVTDFGKHVEAVGELLRRTRDRDYALGKLSHGDDVATPRRAATRKNRSTLVADD